MVDRHIIPAEPVGRVAELRVHAVRSGAADRRDDDVAADVWVVVVQAALGALRCGDTRPLEQERRVAALAGRLIAAESTVRKDLKVSGWETVVARTKPVRSPGERQPEQQPA